MLLAGPGASIENNGLISSVGERVTAIEILDQGARLLNTGDVLASGDLAIGVSFDNLTSASFNIPDGEAPGDLPDAEFLNSGSIIAEGANAVGTSIIMDQGTVINQGSIDRSLGGLAQTASDIGAGLLVIARDVDVENAEGASVTAEGNVSPAFAAFGTNIDFQNDGRISSSGDSAEAVILLGAGYTFQNGATGQITSSGIESPAVRIGPVRDLDNVLGTGIGAFDDVLVALLEGDEETTDFAEFITSLAEADLDPASFDNAGLIEATGIASPAVIVNASGGTIENRAAGTIRSTNDFGLVVGGDRVTINNAGEIAADAAAGSATIRAAWIEAGQSTFNNLGTGMVDGGIIAVLSEVEAAQEREFDLNNSANATIMGPEAVTVLEARTLDLLNEGYEVYIPADACGDVTPEAHERAMDRLVQAGAVPMNSLQFIFELQQDWARGETYDGVMEILKAHTPFRGQFHAQKNGHPKHHGIAVKA